MQINKALANQAIDKLLNTGDAGLRRFGGRIFRSLKGELRLRSTETELGP